VISDRLHAVSSEQGRGALLSHPLSTQRRRPGRLAGITLAGPELSRPFSRPHSYSPVRSIAGRIKRVCRPLGEERRPSHVPSHERSDARVSNYGTNHPCRRYSAGPRRSGVETSVSRALGDVDVKKQTFPYVRFTRRLLASHAPGPFNLYMLGLRRWAALLRDRCSCVQLQTLAP